MTIRLHLLHNGTWTAALRQMAERAFFSAQLLAGEMPTDIDTAFAAARASLVPTSGDDLETHGSCPEWANPCKHVAATHDILGEAPDRDPFLLFELRGRSRSQVLDALRRLRTAGAGRNGATTDEGRDGPPRRPP